MHGKRAQEDQREDGWMKQADNVQLNTASVQCISIAYSEVRITDISEQHRAE